MPDLPDLPDLPDPLTRSTAVIDPTGRYRYSLVRVWDVNEQTRLHQAKPRVCFVMLNPSTADAVSDDPTLRRCLGYAKAWGYGSLEVVNLLAYRSTDPRKLLEADDAIGPENDAFIRRAISRAALVLCAWGTLSHWAGRGYQVLSWIPSPYCLRESKGGDPCHPLYLPKRLTPYPYCPCKGRENGSDHDRQGRSKGRKPRTRFELVESNDYGIVPGIIASNKEGV